MQHLHQKVIQKQNKGDYKMAQKNLKDRLAEKEEALQKAEEKKNFYAKRVAKLKYEVKNLKTERTLALLAERDLDLDDLELFADEIKSLKKASETSSEPSSSY